MKRYAAVGVLALLVGVVVLAQSERKAPVMEVYKSPTCGCCSNWVDHVREAGFTVNVTEMPDQALDALKQKYGVPRTAQSCHTGVVDGYVIEGHVPAAEVHRLLKERPKVTGLAVGGMPIGSPGMEVPGQPAQTYNVVTFDAQGNTRVYSTQNK